MYNPTAITLLPQAHKQRGVSLFIVLIFLLLSIISVLGAYRVGFLNETIVGNEADVNRTQAAAEAMIRDAEQDIIRGVLSGGTHPLRIAQPNFPVNNAGFDDMVDAVAANDPINSCFAAICTPVNMDALKDIENTAALVNAGGRYGVYTGITATDASTNPILVDSNTNSNSPTRYWIEAFRYTDSPSVGTHPSAALRPDPQKNVIYRITAVAVGRKPGTRVVLKSIFVPYPASTNI